MQSIKIGKHKVKLFSEIEEMPIKRYQKFNKYLLIDAHIGSDIQQVDQRFSNLYQFIKHDKKDKALTEIQNLRQSIYMVLNERSVISKALICMIAEIDGKPNDDLSEEGINNTYEILSPGLTKKNVSDLTDEVKKK